MRLESVRARNLGPFRDFTLDLTGPERIVAITGENGAGKSTILELGLPGALYRQTPTRGSLVDLATARDASLEVRVVNAAAWTFRHLVDKVPVSDLCNEYKLQPSVFYHWLKQALENLPN